MKPFPKKFFGLLMIYLCYFRWQIGCFLIFMILGIGFENLNIRFFSDIIGAIKDNDFNNVSNWLNSVGNYLVIYPLATPIVIDLPDGDPIITLNGTNNIYADTGDSQVTYLATPEEAEAAQQRSLSKGSPSEEPEEEEEKPEEEPIEEPKDTGNER